MVIVTTSAKGQVVIPASIRQAVGLAAGQKVAVRLGEDGEIILRPLLKDPINDLFGACKHGGSLTKALEKERRTDGKREAEKGPRRVGDARVSTGRAKRRGRSQTAAKS